MCQYPVPPRDTAGEEGPESQVEALQRRIANLQQHITEIREHPHGLHPTNYTFSDDRNEYVIDTHPIPPNSTSSHGVKRKHDEVRAVSFGNKQNRPPISLAVSFDTLPTTATDEQPVIDVII